MKKYTKQQLETMLKQMSERCIYNINYFGNILGDMKITQEEMCSGENKDRIMKAQLCSATIEMVTDILSPALKYVRSLDSNRDKFFDDLDKIHENTQKRMSQSPKNESQSSQ